jgi:hypothetical protein
VTPRPCDQASARRVTRRWIGVLTVPALALALAAGPGADEGRAMAAQPAASAVAPASAASTAPAPAPVFTPAASAASAPGAARASAPATAASAKPAVRLAPSVACRPDVADPDRCGPLTLEREPFALPGAGLGRPYARAIRAEGGSPPYVFDVMQGNLPGGLMLDPHGWIVGTPIQAGGSRFRLRVVDAAGDVASQTYSLRVVAPGTPAAKPASAPASAAAAQLSQVDLNQAGPPANAAPSARVYHLEPAALDALAAIIQSADAPADATPPPDSAPAPEASASAPAPTPVPAPPPGLAWTDAQQSQLQALLKPVMAVEYPTQALFEAAVDAQVCAQAWQLIVHEAQRLKQQAPSEAAFAEVCSTSARPAPAGTADKPGKADKTPARPGAAASAAAPVASGVAAADAAQAVSWRSLPGWLMPPGLRDWLVEAAARDRPLLPPKPLQWTATPSCNCTAPRVLGPLFAVYPAWLADGPQPQVFDFSLINRVSYFALPLGDDQALDQAMNWSAEQTAFIRSAHAHETRVDIGLYRADWRFLATEPAATRDALVRQLTTQVPRRARDARSGNGRSSSSRAKAWLPGFGEVQRTGDGFTVFFDRLPDPDRDPALAARFADFLPRFIKGLAQAMNENRERKYAINLVMTDHQVTNQPGPFEVGRLFDMLKAVEDPEMAEGRIVETNGDYTRHSNIEMRFLVLLTEPTTQSKKKLRSTIEAGAGLLGGDRRIFLRSVVPLLLLPQASAAQYRDDLVYLQDNFGGAGFWPAPLMGQQFDADQAKALRNTFGPDPGVGVNDALCSVVCPNRWLFRVAFELLLLVGAVGGLLLQWNCEWRARYGRYALLGAIPPLLVGAALLQCDPVLEALRKGNAQLLALLAIPLLAALWALLKRKEDKP